MVDAQEQTLIQKQLAASVKLIQEAEQLLHMSSKNITPETANNRATTLLLSAIARLLALQAAKEAHILSQTVF
jgi:hypothetical protein